MEMAVDHYVVQKYKLRLLPACSVQYREHPGFSVDSITPFMLGLYYPLIRNIELRLDICRLQ